MPSYKFATLALLTYLALSITASPIANTHSKRDPPLNVDSLRPEGVPPIEQIDGPSRGASGLPSENFAGLADPPPPPADASTPDPADNHGNPAIQPHGVGPPPGGRPPPRLAARPPRGGPGNRPPGGRPGPRDLGSL